MKRVTLLLIALIACNATFACLSASQNRIFPLGTCSTGVVAVETRLYRRECDNGPEELKLESCWRGVAYFRVFDKNFSFGSEHEVIDTIKLFPETDYDSVITNILQRGLTHARKLTGFIPATPLSISFCDYRQTCSKASLVFDTIKNEMLVKLPDKKSYPVNILSDSSSVACNIFFFWRNFYAPEPIVSALRNELYINSVRQFEIGEKKLTVVHIGLGQRFESSDGRSFYPPGEEYAAEFVFNDLNKSVFIENVIHHGAGFDFFILE